MPATPIRNLEPASLVSLAWAHPREAFVARVEAPLLLVRLEDARGEMASVLREIEVQGGARLEATIGFETRSSVEEPRKSGKRPLGFGAGQLAIRLVRGPHFAIPVRKRKEAGKGFSQRVSVGRARNNDVVLRHESVSKFHAWFRCDEDGVHYVGDAPSHNGTFVNGARIDDAHRLDAGDEIAFGAVEALFCPASTIWDAIRSGA